MNPGNPLADRESAAENQYIRQQVKNKEIKTRQEELDGYSMSFMFIGSCQVESIARSPKEKGSRRKEIDTICYGWCPLCLSILVITLRPLPSIPSPPTLALNSHTSVVNSRIRIFLYLDNKRPNVFFYMYRFISVIVFILFI